MLCLFDRTSATAYGNSVPLQIPIDRTPDISSLQISRITMLATFFVSWPLWEQMTLVRLEYLLGRFRGLILSRFYSVHWYIFAYHGYWNSKRLTLQVLTLGAGMAKNLYTWRKDRKYSRMFYKSSKGRMAVPQDVEAQGMAINDAIPFGIKALQQGVEVEGIWVSQPNTPAPGSPVISAYPSPVLSLVGGISLNSLPSGNISPPEIALNHYTHLRHSIAKIPRSPSLALDPIHSRNGDRDGTNYEYSSTLDALEGRWRSQELDAKITHSDQQWPTDYTSQDGLPRYYSRSFQSQRSRSDFHSPRSARSSIGECSPSPPALTDGASRSETPLSTDIRPHLSSYLSESNHRLSHVAETGQLYPRVRLPKVYDNMTLSGSDASSYRSTLHIPYGGPIYRTPSRLSTSPSPPSPMGSSFTDHRAHSLNSPSPAQGVRNIGFDLHSIHCEPAQPAYATSQPIYSPRHSQAISNSQIIAGHQPTPLLVEYMSSSFSDGSVPVVRDFTDRHTLENNDVTCSICNDLPNSPSSSPSVSLVPIIADSQYRKVNPNFEMQSGARGSLAIPLELPSLELWDTTSPKREKRKSRKLQKKRPIGRIDL
jgi:hypothetical protein